MLLHRARVDLGAMAIRGVLSIIGASPSDCLVSYSGHPESYPSAERQLMYSVAPADWAT